MSGYLADPVLAGVDHGFGTRGAPAPAGCVRPHQVHGATVVDAEACRGVAVPPDADAVISTVPGLPVAVVTADCVPVLLAAPGAVAAVHAGWRGVAAGIVTAAVDALRRAAGCGAVAVRAAIGPHIGSCCYEVDDPVLERLERRHARSLPGAVQPTRPGHGRLDLGCLVRAELTGVGLDAAFVGTGAAGCTSCAPERFESHRRDGPRAGRLLHYVAAPAQG